MVDLTPYKSKLEEGFKYIEDVSYTDPRVEFEKELQQYGYRVPRVLKIGRVDRIDCPSDKKGKKSGWYLYNEVASSFNEGQQIGIAVFGDWRTGERITWCSRTQSSFTPSERAEYHAARAEMEKRQREEQELKWKEAEEKASDILKGAEPCISHEYLTNKGVGAYGVFKANDGRLIVPAMQVTGGYSSLQFISGDGSKRFLTGGKLKGAFYFINGSIDTIYIAEGYSTAASVHEATGALVYIAFNAGNLYEIASMVKSNHEGCRIVMAADNDFKTETNVGKNKAMQANDGLGLDGVILPPEGFVDFNDAHQELGIEELKKHFNPKILPFVKKPEPKTQDVVPPKGFLRDVYDYYNATAGNEQKGFAVQTALSIASVVLARKFKTEFDNFPSLYFLNVAKSGTGKEHTKKVIDKVLESCDMMELRGGDGFTSGGAVFSALMSKPRHISVIDEFGRYLEAGRDMKGSNHQREANTKLMEAFGRLDGTLIPPTYSTMTLKKKDAKELENRFVCNPAITLMTMTTPDTLFNSIDMGAIKDGFFNRFLVSISDAERSRRKTMPSVEVPEKIKSWIKTVNERLDVPMDYMEKVDPVVLSVSEDANELQYDFQDYCIDQANKLERFGMSELSGRSNEIALRIALICALSRDEEADVVTGEDMQWAIDYVKMCLTKTVNKLKMTLSSSSFEGYKKEILQDLRDRGESGITWAMMQKNSPYSKHKPKDLKEILQALKDADLAEDEAIQTGKRGRPTIRWVAI